MDNIPHELLNMNRVIDKHFVLGLNITYIVYKVLYNSHEETREPTNTHRKRASV